MYVLTHLVSQNLTLNQGTVIPLFYIHKSLYRHMWHPAASLSSACSLIIHAASLGVYLRSCQNLPLSEEWGFKWGLQRGLY